LNNFVAKFRYLAKNLKNTTETGVLECKNEKELSDALGKKGFFLIRAECLGGKVKEGASLKFFSFLAGFLTVPLSEKLFFTRNLQVMAKSGVALPRAFHILSCQTKNKPFKKVLASLGEAVTRGDSLSDALSHHPKVFSLIYRESIKVGEETGKLTESLEMMNSQMEREYSLKTKVKTAMTYPMVVCFMALLIGVFMFVFAVPKLKEAFSELNVDLPFATDVIFFLGDFTASNWKILLPIVFLFIFSLFLFWRWKRIDKAKALLFLKMPMIKTITRQLNEVITLRTLSSLLSAGVPVVKSLQLTAGALNNFYFKNALQKASLQVEKGKKISDSLAAFSNIYSPMVLQMLEIGEETGETSTILVKLADFYEDELSHTLERISSMIEPLLIVGIGIAVGFFAVSMIQPMMNIMSAIQ